jgi:hypothetical protein
MSKRRSNTLGRPAKHYHQSAPRIIPRKLKRLETLSSSSNRGLIGVRIALLEPALFPYVVCSIERAIHRGMESNDGIVFTHKKTKLAYYRFQDSSRNFRGAGLIVRECLVFDLSQFAMDDIDIAYASENGDEEKIAKLAKYDHFFVLSAGRAKNSVIVDVKKSISPISNFVFIGGAAKSGTTWVERILNAHPEVLLTGENHLFSWPPEHTLRAIFSHNRHPYFYSLMPNPRADHLYAGIFRWGFACILLSQYKAVSGVSVIGDKSPTYSQHVAEILSLFPNARYLHCVRNPLDVAVSRIFHEANLLNDSPELSAIPRGHRSHVVSLVRRKITKGEMFREPALLRWALDEWINANVMVGRLRSSHSDRILTVRYEVLTSNNTSQIERILRFVGVRADMPHVRKCKLASDFAMLSGGRSPGEENVRSFYRKGIIGDYATYLSASQIKSALSYLSKTTRGESVGR